MFKKKKEEPKEIHPIIQRWVNDVEEVNSRYENVRDIDTKSNFADDLEKQIAVANAKTKYKKNETYPEDSDFLI